jgi:hypothetical protein
MEELDRIQKRFEAKMRQVFGEDWDNVPMVKCACGRDVPSSAAEPKCFMCRLEEWLAEYDPNDMVHFLDEC